MKSVYIYPGQLAVSQEPAALSTLLGSCVGVALYDPARRSGGLNHFLLPVGPQGTPPSFRYGDHALEELLGLLVEAGSRPRDLQAKIYGGNLVVEGLAAADVGARNISFARQWLEGRGIPVLESRTGAERGCRITLRTDTFDVDYRLIASSEPPRAPALGESPVGAGNSAAAMSGVAGKAGGGRKVRVLVVDDSATVRSVFNKVLVASGRIEVVGMARDPYEAREILVRERPEVVLLDVELPRMTGVAFLEKVMLHMPTPVIMVSSLGSNDAAALRSLEVGAVEFVHKPSQFDPTVLRELADVLVAKVLAAAAEPIERVKSRARRSAQVLTSPRQLESLAALSRPRGAMRSRAVEVVLVGGNSGSQFAFQDLLAGLPADTPPLVAAIGPIAPFVSQFCQTHAASTAARLRAASDGLALAQGDVVLVPHGHQARIESPRVGRYVVRLAKGPAIRGNAPSSTELFSSAACLGRAAGVVGVLLSGFGSDGVEGLVSLREKGAHTVVVSPESAPFPFVPEEAIRQGAADEVVAPGELAAAIMRQRSRLAS